MNILDGTLSWVMKCDHIGEAKLFGYILGTFNQSDMTWTNTADAQRAVEQLLGIKRPTMFNYLKNLCKNGLLSKLGKGSYKLNELYVQYGRLPKPENPA